MGIVNTNGTLSNALRDMNTFSGTDPEQLDDCHKKGCFTLSIAGPDVFSC